MWLTVNLSDKIKSSSKIDYGIDMKDKDASTFGVFLFWVSRNGFWTADSEYLFYRNVWARIFKCLWGPGIDSKEWIPPAYVAWRAGTITLYLLGS